MTLSEAKSTIQRAMNRFWRERSPTEIPDSIPLAAEFCEEFVAPKSKRVFADMDFLFIQHFLGSLIPRIQIMRDYGLNLSRCWFVDIPYSTNRNVSRELRRMKVPSNQIAKAFNDPVAPYERRQIERIELLLTNLVDSGNSKIVVIDDGGYFIRTLNHMLPRNKKAVLRGNGAHAWWNRRPEVIAI